jgi:hypothetical protein
MPVVAFCAKACTLAVGANHDQSHEIILILWQFVNKLCTGYSHIACATYLWVKFVMLVLHYNFICPIFIFVIGDGKLKLLYSDRPSCGNSYEIPVYLTTDGDIGKVP